MSQATIKLAFLLSCFFATILAQKTIVACSSYNFGCQSCFINSDQEELCSICLPGYRLGKELCVYDPLQCTALYGQICNINYCKKQTSHSICDQCLDKFIKNNNLCLFNCSNSPLGYVSQPLDCFKNCNKVSGCFCATLSSTECFTCITGEYFYKGVCQTQCNQSYFPNSRNTCVPCPIGCLTCTSLDTCTTCQNGWYFFNNHCLDKCPFYATPDGTSCKRICDDGKHSYYQNQCQLIDNRWNTYCTFIIPYIPELILFSSNIQGGVILKIQMLEIPSTCFDVQIYGSKQEGNFKIPVTFQTQGNGSEFIGDISYLTTYSCSIEYCLLYLKIYYLGELKQMYSVKLNTSFDKILEVKIIFSGDQNSFIPVVVGTPIPPDQITSATITFYCGPGQTYENGTLTAIHNPYIHFIQTIDDAFFNQTLIKPHSVKQISDNGILNQNSITLFDYSQNQYYYNNYQYQFEFDNYGKVSYNFESYTHANYTIQIVSYIKDYQSQQFYSLQGYVSPLPITYLVSTVKLNIVGGVIDELNLKLYIGAGAGGFFLLMIIICWIRYCKRRRRESIQVEDLEKKDKSDEVSQVRRQSSIQLTDTNTNSSQVKLKKERTTQSRTELLLHQLKK